LALFHANPMPAAVLQPVPAALTAASGASTSTRTEPAERGTTWSPARGRPSGRRPWGACSPLPKRWSSRWSTRASSPSGRAASWSIRRRRRPLEVVLTEAWTTPGDPGCGRPVGVAHARPRAVQDHAIHRLAGARPRM